MCGRPGNSLPAQSGNSVRNQVPTPRRGSLPKILDSVVAFGYPLPATTRWWTGLTTPVSDDLICETGTRTFALNEVNVRPDWQGQGVAHALHDELLGSRPEKRATLLVREDNTVAQHAYAKWGWKKIGQLRPYPDGPHFDAMLLPLPLKPADAGSRLGHG